MVTRTRPELDAGVALGVMRTAIALAFFSGVIVPLFVVLAATEMPAPNFVVLPAMPTSKVVAVGMATVTRTDTALTMASAGIWMAVSVVAAAAMVVSSVR